MRQKRAKTYKRLMALYVQTFNFRQPYQVLVSHDLLLALNQESDLHRQLMACTQGEVKPMITQCCMEALYKLGRPHQTTIDLAKTLERRRCNHREAIDPYDCLKDVIGETNKHRYILTLQSPTLLSSTTSFLTTTPSLPVIHFNPRGVLVLSPPNRATMKVKAENERMDMMRGGGILEGVVDGGNVVGADDGVKGKGKASGEGTGVGRGVGIGLGSGSGIGERSRRKIRGVNPLSVKKKVKKDDTGSTKKRNRDDEGDEAGGGGDGGEMDLGVGETEIGVDGERKKKKRKRKGKGVVAEAIKEIRDEREAKARAGDEGAEVVESGGED